MDFSEILQTQRTCAPHALYGEFPWTNLSHLYARGESCEWGWRFGIIPQRLQQVALAMRYSQVAPEKNEQAIHNVTGVVCMFAPWCDVCVWYVCYQNEGQSWLNLSEIYILFPKCYTDWMINRIAKQCRLMASVIEFIVWKRPNSVTRWFNKMGSWPGIFQWKAIAVVRVNRDYTKNFHKKKKTICTCMSRFK